MASCSESMRFCKINIHISNVINTFFSLPLTVIRGSRPGGWYRTYASRTHRWFRSNFLVGENNSVLIILATIVSTNARECTLRISTRNSKPCRHLFSTYYDLDLILIIQATQIYCNAVMWASVTKTHVYVLTQLHPAFASAVKRRKETETSHLNRAFWWTPCWWQMTVFRLAVPPRWQINSYPLDIIMTHFQHQGQSKEQWSKNIECNMFCCTSGRQRTLARRVCICIWDCPQGKSRPQHSNHSKKLLTWSQFNFHDDSSGKLELS